MSSALAFPPLPTLGESAIVLDVDGTLVAIEQEPEAVVVSEALRALLARLIRATDGALALVSGRSIDQLDRLFAPIMVSASGLHGLERRLLPGGSPDAWKRAMRSTRRGRRSSSSQGTIRARGSRTKG
jgi:trehalose 6-phosphate phosphatase